MLLSPSTIRAIVWAVHNTPFSPTVPEDATLAAMSDAQFDSFLDAWVDRAESAAFVTVPPIP